MAKLLDATELWECRLWTLLPGLHHTALRSHKGFPRVGQGTPSRGWVHSPSLSHPCWASRSFCPTLLPSFPFNISCIYLNECSSHFICNPNITWVPFNVWRPWVRFHHVHYLASLKFCLDILLVSRHLHSGWHMSSHPTYMNPGTELKVPLDFILWMLNSKFYFFQ